VCAWCQHESRPALLREVEPLDDVTETHGICETHHVAVMRQLLGEAGVKADTGDLRPALRELQCWLQASPPMIGDALDRIVEEIARLDARARAREAERAHLESEVAWLADEVASLRIEHDALATWRRDAARVAATLLDHVLEGTLHPLHDVVARLRAAPRPGDRGRAAPPVDRRDDSL
jgi:hypothetical protein